MLSDESSSDSETGRFKCQAQDKPQRSSDYKEHPKSLERPRHSQNDRFRREYDRRRDSRNNSERNRYSRSSPTRNRNYSRERSSHKRRSHERKTYEHDSRSRSKPREIRSNSRDKPKHSKSHLRKSSPHMRNLKDEIKRNLIPKDKFQEKSYKKSLSPDAKIKRSEVHKHVHRPFRKKSLSPVYTLENIKSDVSDEVQVGSYYNMKAVVKEISEESSEIDSSDDERLRAKLLNLEKELHKTRKKKHKRKHKKRNSKSKEKDLDTSTFVEVSSTTDIQDKTEVNSTVINIENTEVTSTQKSNQKDSCEEGELPSDSENEYVIDPTDLRHKIKRTGTKVNVSDSSDLRDRLKIKSDVCGPALPPHLKREKSVQSISTPEKEGPILPPHLQKSKTIGPAIPEYMREVLAKSEYEVIKGETSEEEDGIGPLPEGSYDKLTEAHQRLEERALDMKIKKLEGHSINQSKIKSREEWMLELPDAKAKYLGLEARSFRAKEGPDMSDRSSWTDTPEEKARKAAGKGQQDYDKDLKCDARALLIAKRDAEQEKSARKHKKKYKRDESLLDMHQKKLKKKSKKEDKEEGKSVRRPFSRDIDLQVNRFDEAQKRSIIKKAQNLDSRFSRGEAKYL